jgi:hypothetical protein
MLDETAYGDSQLPHGGLRALVVVGKRGGIDEERSETWLLQRRIIQDA